MRRSQKRALMKATTWRMFSGLLTAGLVLALTGNYAISGIIFVFDSIVKFSAFYVHERIWHAIKKKQYQKRTGQNDK